MKLKSILTQQTFLLLFATFVLLSCKTDDDASINPIDKLPEATQTGAQTFGCLINGEPFSLKYGGARAFYQYVSGSYTLGISATKKRANPIFSVMLAAVDVDDFGIGSYSLKNEKAGNFSGRYLIGGGVILRSTTKDDLPGELIITRFDKSGEYIISGTFSFTIKDDEGNDMHITDGRFDLRYTN